MMFLVGASSPSVRPGTAEDDMPSGGPRIAKRQKPWIGGKQNRFRQIDGRIYEGKLERRTIADLSAHLGGDLTVPQEILVRQCAKLVVVLDVLGVELVDKGEVSDFASRRYLAWVGQLRRTLETVGIERPQQAPKRLADVLKIKGAA
jgi:hypothetical protein